MKLLLFTYEFPPKAGGIGRYCHELAKEISRSKNNVVVLTRRYSQNDMLLDNKAAFKTIRIPNTRCRKMDILIGCLYFIHHVYRFKPDHILVTHGTSQRICSLLTLIFKFKFSITVHGSDIAANAKTKIKKWLFAKLFSKSQKILAVSNFTKSLLTYNFNVSEEKIHVIHHGIDVAEFLMSVDEKALSKLRERLNITDQKVILTLARLIPRKGQDTVIEALPRVIKKFPKLKYVIGGGGTDLHRLKKLVDDYNLENYVVFVGSIPHDEVITYYDMCDIFVMSLSREGDTIESFGISFIEAGARAKALIGGNYGGVPEAIINEETGFLVNPYDIEELATAIIRLLNDDRLAEDMGKRGRERVFKYFTSEIMTKRTLEAITRK